MHRYREPAEITSVPQMEPTAVNKDPDILQGYPAGNKAAECQWSNRIPVEHIGQLNYSCQCSVAKQWIRFMGWLKLEVSVCVCALACLSHIRGRLAQCWHEIVMISEFKKNRRSISAHLGQNHRPFTYPKLKKSISYLGIFLTTNFPDFQTLKTVRIE